MNFVLQHIALIKVATDVSLVFALLYLGLRVYRSPRAAASAQKIGQLEGSLRTLVKDADIASRGLNDQLLKRQQSLEKILLDLEGLEQRVIGSISSADEKKIAIEAQINAAKRVLDQFSGEMARRQVAEVARAPQLSQAPLEGRVLDAEPVAEPQSFRGGMTPPTAKKARTTAAHTNIYGEPIGAAPRTAPPPLAAPTTHTPVRKATQRYMQGLARKVEREVMVPAGEEVSLNTSIEEVYDAAERLLRTGKEAAFVAHATNLPLEEVEALARLANATSATSQAAQEVPTTAEADDPRLGVLTGIKRQVQVL